MLVRESHCAPFTRSSAPRTAAHPKIPNLTDRELHVFAFSGAGLGTSRIAQELGISPRTVETYHEHIKLKLGYRNAKALRRGAREWFESITVSSPGTSGIGEWLKISGRVPDRRSNVYRINLAAK